MVGPEPRAKTCLIADINHGWSVASDFIACSTIRGMIVPVRYSGNLGEIQSNIPKREAKSVPDDVADRGRRNSRPMRTFLLCSFAASRPAFTTVETYSDIERNRKSSQRLMSGCFTR